MHPLKITALASASVVAIALGACSTRYAAPGNSMTFFVTSSNAGKGADFGGLAGADAYCQTLAEKAGAGGRLWRAYLSTTGSAAVNARDRIGPGPWQNAKGEVIANSVEELHSDNRLNKQTALTETGQIIKGRGDDVNTHDILTGSTPDGRAPSTATDSTCGNWTSSNEGSAIVGHHDRTGINETAPQKSWNSSHATPGCSMEALKKVGGAGLLYCFAAR